MSKRKPIWILSLRRRAVVLIGRVTIDVAPTLNHAEQRAVTAGIVKDLRSIGIEASPKIPEIRR